MGWRLAAGLVLALALPTSAAEIDSVTARGAALRDSMDPMNAWVNARARLGVTAANERGEGCDEAVLYGQLKRAFASPFIGHRIAEALNADPALDSRRVRLEDSIYRDLGPLDAISVHWKDLSAVVRLGSDRVGVDKLGHFFVEGWRYFEVAQLRGEGLSAAMEWGERTERTYFGLYTTAVYSYADLAANFEGSRFWLRVLGSGRDPLETGLLPARAYVRCSRRLFFGAPRWKLSRAIDLADYVSAAWDEGMNCPRFRNAEIEATVAARIHEQEAEAGRALTCPIDSRRCAGVRERYGVYADRLLHPRCLEVEVPRRPWWRLWGHP